ncbi:MAG: glycosyl hydrolase family 28 protein [Saprospiraceae bacterium]|jgi:polygalacturonase|nr:glycosyl hydrolase family 28 protein [Saprospiraceae bacterium]
MSFRIISVLLFLFVATSSFSKDYRASFFGIQSNGITLNTTSIQKAIDYIHENGGGRLVFEVGRYLTGSIFLKSNVTLHLEEGAVLIGSLNPFDYYRHGHWTSLLFALEQNNIGLTGKGVVDGRGYDVAQRYLEMIHKGIIKDLLIKDRPKEGVRPHNIFFLKCNGITIKDITLKNPGSWTQQYDRCTNLTIENTTVDSKNYWNNDGIDIVDCDSVIVRNNYIDASDDGICLKSHSKTGVCQHILIENNTVRSSASGIKFGTYSWGGFQNIKIINNTIFDTYRSAITFAAVDGAFIQDIVVDSLKAYNTGNIIFLRIGERREGRKGSMKNIQISNIYGEVAASKADAGYPYEGPIEHQPRNISPASIVGMPDVAIENVILKNIEIHYPGGGNSQYAKVSLDELDKVPELEAEYPEFSMFKELPAWGFYVRHAKGITFENLTMSCQKKDYRMPIVLDDAQNILFKDLKIKGIVQKETPVFSKDSSFEIK